MQSQFIYCHADYPDGECLYAECFYDECHYAECHYSKCRKKRHSVFMLNVVAPSIVSVERPVRNSRGLHQKHFHGFNQLCNVES
jgi:hypothetical protein